MVRLAAIQSNAIVPVVSFMELPRNDWKRLTMLATSRRKPSLVVCTHLDRVSQDNLEQQLWMVSSTFWPESPSNDSRILKCSSLIGFSANQLLEQMKDKRPPFSEIEGSLGYHVSNTPISLI